MPSSSKVEGVVQVSGVPVSRTVKAFSYQSIVHDIDGESRQVSKSLGEAVSTSDTGSYSIELYGGYQQEVFVVAFDDYGEAFSPNMVMAVGDRVHPTTPNGYVWECTVAGTLPASEPVWQIDDGASYSYGSASLKSVPFYRPRVHGPILPLVEVVVVNYGIIITALAYSNMESPQYDVAATSEPTWTDNFGQTVDVGLFRYNTGPAPTTLPRTVEVIDWDEDWQTFFTFNNAYWNNDDHELRMDFLNSLGEVVYTLHSYKSGNFASDFRYGVPGALKAPGGAGYKRIDGYFYTQNGFLRYAPRRDNNCFLPFVDTDWPVGQIKQVQVEVFAYSTYSSGGAAGGFAQVRSNRREDLAALPGDTPLAIDSGFLFGCLAVSGSKTGREYYDVLESDRTDWEDNWLQTHKIAKFEFAYAEEDATLRYVRTLMPASDIDFFDNTWIWRVKAQRASYSGDEARGRIELRNVDGDLIYLILIEHRTDYQVEIKHGPNDATLTTIGGTGAARIWDGNLTWRADGFDFVNIRADDYVNSFSANFATTAITKIRFSAFARTTASVTYDSGIWVKVIGRTG